MATRKNKKRDRHKPGFMTRLSGEEDDYGLPVFTHCNVCGTRLRDAAEAEMGMCERCAAQ